MCEDVINIYEAKTHLSKLLARVEAGEEITIARANRPIARLVPIVSPRADRRPGADGDAIWIAEDFDAPLPDSIQASFEGGRLD